MRLYACTLLLLAAAQLAVRCTGLVVHTTVNSTGPAAYQLFTDFGIAAGGATAFDVSVDTPSCTEGTHAFIIVVGHAPMNDFYHPQFKGPTDWETVCSAPSAARFQVTALNTAFSGEAPVLSADRYTAYLLLCEPGSRFAAAITSTLLNLDSSGDLTQQLAIEDAPMPRLYLIVLVLWLTIAAAWAVHLHRCRAFILRVHHLFTAVIAVRVATEALVVAYWYALWVGPGSQTALRTAASLLSNAGKVLFIFTATLLGLGWCYMRQSLSRQEVRLVAAVFAVQTVLSAVDALCLGGGALCGVVALLDYILRSLIMLAMVVAINFNVAHMRAALHVPWTSSMALEYLKLCQYLTFRWTFLAYLLLPIATLTLEYAVLGWELSWISNLLEEFLTAVIMVHIGVTFAPFNTWFVTRAFDHSLE